jgi:regulator of RNase E activity RraB
MTDDWDFYFCQVENKPASIFVDLGIVCEVPIASLPNMAYMRLFMNAPREDGLSSREEFDALVGIEKAMEERLVNEETAYVGRCTHDSCRDFFFYANNVDDWALRVSGFMQSFPAYRHEVGSREDADWSLYAEYLYPKPADRQNIENGRVCDALERNGDGLSEPREIDHWISFPTAQNLDDFVTDSCRLGFATRQISERDGTHWAQIWRVDIPSRQGIDELVADVIGLAAKYGGEYDGWESAVMPKA